jgi:hypothetical protein
MTIAGNWYNELGSHMRLTPDPSGGIAGTYVSASGHAAGSYARVGRYDTPTRADRGTAVGGTVAWRNDQHDADSVTSWNGLYQDDGRERITTTWLLTTSMTVPDAWESSRVGQDVFTRKAPDVGRAEQRHRSGEPVFHPLGVTGSPQGETGINREI